MICSSPATITSTAPPYNGISLPINLLNADDDGGNNSNSWGPFSGQYGTAGVGGNYADGGSGSNSGYYFAANKYIDMGVSIPVSQINQIAFKANLGVGDTNTDQVPCTFSVGTNGSSWTAVGTANGGYNPPAMLTVTRSQLQSMGVSSLRYFRCYSADVVNEFWVTIS